MQADFKIKKQNENALTTPHSKPVVQVKGKMALSKKFSLDYFSKMIEEFGVLKDFKKASNTTLNFFVFIDIEKILPLIKALETDKYFVVDEIKDVRTFNGINPLQLILLLNVTTSSKNKYQPTEIYEG